MLVYLVFPIMPPAPPLSRHWPLSFSLSTAVDGVTRHAVSIYPVERRVNGLLNNNSTRSIWQSSISFSIQQPKSRHRIVPDLVTLYQFTLL